MTTLPINSVSQLRFYTLPEVIPPNFDPGLGGMYATAKDGLERPIKVGAQVPNLMAFQQWILGTPNEDEEQQIVFVPSGEQHIEHVTGFTNTSQVPGTPITLSSTPSLYKVHNEGKTKDGLPIVTIHPVGRPDLYVGASEENIVELQDISIPGEGRPGWIVYG
ncbi:hypothetical protein FRC08_007421 [Ceratobasidium sp. 394]|nr:hypothetical protein FRC08_007421 [Ceratobasidium sp. 394]